MNISLFQSVLLAAILSYLFCLIIGALPASALTRLFVQLGLLSMPIYLAHTIFTVGMRTVLFKFTEAATPHLILGTIAGLIGPALLYYGLRRISLTRVAGF